MADLSDLALRTSYHKGQDDIAADFYLPCMERSATYDRAVAYFRSAAFIVAWPALPGFVGRGGHIRVLCSQVLAPDDIDALEAGYSARADATLADRFLEEVRSLVNDKVMREPTRILAALVARGTIDLQIAVLRATEVESAPTRIFHDKLGIFADEHGHTLVFKGSMNETWAGLAADGNLESIDVAASWLGERDLERVDTEIDYFSSLWENRYPGLNVRPFPEVAREELRRVADPDWEGTLELEIKRQADAADGRGRTLLPHQAAGLAAWKANGRRGILEFATGSGKTFMALTAIREALIRGEVALIVVPDNALFGQWLAEIQPIAQALDAHVLRAGAGNSRWRDHLRDWTCAGEPRRIVLATVNTATSSDFRTRLSGGEHLLLVADEVHRLGSPQNRQLLQEDLFGPRLGLSATPRRAGDPEGTRALLDFFGGILQPPYTLADAIRDRVLTPYFYRPHTLELKPAEKARWDVFTAKIGRARAQLAAGSGSQDAEESLRRLLINRARIVKRAGAKPALALEVLSADYKAGQRWIVYCDDLGQLETVSHLLEDNGIANLPYHSQMDGDRAETLKWLDRRGGIVVAIKCLDEGVDIPSVTHALILASSRNPREFVQRRGRVLRKAPNKALAYVHDALVLPPRSGGGSGGAGSDPITGGELARAIEFASHADNPGALSDLEQIAIEAGIDWASLIETGVEDADD
jgi:superfamily II DNA or RNA helicase